MPDMFLPLALAKVSGPAVATAFAPKNVSQRQKCMIIFFTFHLLWSIWVGRLLEILPAWVGNLRVYLPYPMFFTTRSLVEIYNPVNMMVGRQVTFETICVMHLVIQIIMKFVQRSRRIFGLKVDRVTQVSMGSGAFVFINWAIGYVVPVLTMA